MANPAYGQASRDRMARNHRALGDRFTYEPGNRCDGTTKKGERCWSRSQYGANSQTTERPSWRGPVEVDRYYCHRHATALLESERGN